MMKVLGMGVWHGSLQILRGVGLFRIQPPGKNTFFAELIQVRSWPSFPSRRKGK